MGGANLSEPRPQGSGIAFALRNAIYANRFLPIGYKRDVPSLPARWGYIRGSRLRTEALRQAQEQFGAERAELVTEERGLKRELGRRQAELGRPGT